MLKIREAIVVEGRYDKISLENVVDTAIFVTDGFGIFNDREKMALLRRVAEKRGLIVLTDSDGAGFVIRNRLRGSIDQRYLKHAYIPDVPGRERRKKTGSKEGTLGVEGMSREVLEEVIRRAGTVADCPCREPVTKADMVSLGLSGGADSAAHRQRLLRALELPAKMSPNALVDAINCLFSREEFLSFANSLQKQGGDVPQKENGG